MTTHKGYISRWKQREKPHELIMDYWFTSNPESAAYWETKEEADGDCGLFERNKIEIPSAEGGTYICKGFKSEELRPGRFVVFCEAPFIPQQTSGQSTKTT